jgi:hypothetical protein
MCFFVCNVMHFVEIVFLLEKMIGGNGPMSALMSVSLNRALHPGAGGGDGQDAEVAKFC